MRSPLQSTPDSTSLNTSRLIGRGLVALILLFVVAGRPWNAHGARKHTGTTKKAAAANTKKGAKPTLDAATILKRSDSARAPQGTFSFHVKVKDFEDNRKLHETVYKVYAKGEKYALVETMSPVRMKGRKLLMRDTDLWLWLPTVKRPTRVSMQQRLTGEVANGDIARTRFFVDYLPTVAGMVNYGKKPHYQLDLKARHKDTTYRRLQLYVDQATLRPGKAFFYAISGKLLKTATYSTYRQVFGQLRATKVIIQDALKPSKQSHLSYFGYRREKLDDSFFTKENLL